MTYSASDLVYSYLVTATVPENDPLFLGTYLSIGVDESTQRALSAWLIQNNMRFTRSQSWHATVFKTVLHKFNCLADAGRKVKVDPTKCRFDLLGREDILCLVIGECPYFMNRRYNLLIREKKEAERLHVTLPTEHSYTPHLTLSNRGRPEDVSRLNAAWSSFKAPIYLKGERQFAMRLKHPRRESTPMIRRDIAESLREDLKKR